LIIECLDTFTFGTWKFSIFSPLNSILELPILGFRTTHFPIRIAHFEKWEALG
jgi:hypothetical protein